MAKLIHVADVIAKNELRIGKGGNQFPIKPRDTLQLINKDGKSVAVSVLAVVGKELVVREAAEKGPSKIKDQLQSWNIVKTALWGAGIAKFFSKKD
jgi:hypothetical protein